MSGNLVHWTMQTCSDIQVTYGDSCLKNQENAKLWCCMSSHKATSNKWKCGTVRFDTDYITTNGFSNEIAGQYWIQIIYLHSLNVMSWLHRTNWTRWIWMPTYMIKTQNNQELVLFFFLVAIPTIYILMSLHHSEWFWFFTSNGQSNEWRCSVIFIT